MIKGEGIISHSRRTAQHSFDAIGRWMRQRGIRFSFRDLRLILARTRYLSIPRHAVIMPQGRAVEHLYFINSGIARLLRRHDKGEVTLAFVPEREFASTVVYIVNGQPSPCALEAVTGLQALYWSKEDVLYLRDALSAAAAVESALLERLLSWNQDRELDIMSHSPEERYMKLLDMQPEIVRQVPLKYIASYLGIHQDSLSRIRNKVARKS